MKRKPLASIAIFVSAAFAVVVTGFLSYYWDSTHSDASSAPTLLFTAAAVIPMALVYWLLRRRTKDQDISNDRRGLIQDRYARAIEELGHEEPAVRMRGIFTLENIAEEKQDYEAPIVHKICAFARSKSSRYKDGYTSQRFTFHF